MSDIFISYSSKDREKAEQLTELLASAGLSVWIDQSGIEISSSWSKEIVQAINSCKAFVVLLSPDSIISRNVIKEVSLASEKAKKILPLDLEPVTLPEELEYQLAGIQRSSMTNIDAIIRALGKLGLEATQAPKLTLVKETGGKKSLMILPFEDLSPTADNGWFADGIVSELINALSNVKALKVADQQTTKEFKSYKGHLAVYAREMSIRYFVQGDVRKFGDQIKISARLLDIEAGEHLWQDSTRSTMDNVFDIQEDVARKVVAALKIHLADDEEKMLAERGTNNVEAYELYLRARELASISGEEQLRAAIDLYSQALKLDATFYKAADSKAYRLMDLYRIFERDEKILLEAEKIIADFSQLQPQVVYGDTASRIALYRGDVEKAEQLGKLWVRKEPLNARAHQALGFHYYLVRNKQEAIRLYEDAIQIAKEYPELETSVGVLGDQRTYFNICAVCETAGDLDRLRRWAIEGLPIFERKLRLNPNDKALQMDYAHFLFWSGDQNEKGIQLLESLANFRDGRAQFNLGCCWLRVYQPKKAAEAFSRALDCGFVQYELMAVSMDDTPFRSDPEFENVFQKYNDLYQKRNEANTKTNV